MLKIAVNLSLPTEAVTQTFAILAKRGVGKTYTASVMAEEMLKARMPIIAIDPTGAWWGLRSKYPVVILGGEHADVPLEHTAGEVVARSIIENRFPAVVDLSLFRKGQLITFMVAFAETLYRLNRDAVHLFVDEADAVAPQAKNYGGDENRMLGAMEDIVRRGRKRGIGCTLITQRPAVLNKNVLTQCENLLTLRLVHPKDIDALKEWVNVHAEPDVAKEMISSLPSLPIGTAWFWSPGWMGEFKRVAIRERETFDSGATPKPGEKAKQPKSLAEIDIAALGDAIKATVERAKADDPKELKRQIVELKKQAAAKQPAAIDQAAIDRAVSSAVVARDRQWEQTIKDRERIIGEFKGRLGKIASLAHVNGEAAPKVDAPEKVLTHQVKAIPQAPAKTVYQPRKEKSAEPAGDGSISPRQQRFLDAAATLTVLNVEVSRETVAAWVGVHPRGGSVGEELKALANAGLITMDRGRIQVTESGMAAATQTDPAEAIENAKSGLTARQQRFFSLIVEAYPGSTTREAIAEAMQIHPRGGSLGEDLGRLVGRGLVERDRSSYRARDFLFAGSK